MGFGEAIGAFYSGYFDFETRAKQGRLAPMYPSRSAYKLDEPTMRVYLGAFIWLNILMLISTRLPRRLPRRWVCAACPLYTAPPLYIAPLYTAPWHKGKDLRALIENTGAKLLMLPPYSPDLNPIEHAGANLKAAIKSNTHRHKNISQNIKAQLKNMNHSILA